MLLRRERKGVFKPTFASIAPGISAPQDETKKLSERAYGKITYSESRQRENSPETTKKTRGSSRDFWRNTSLRRKSTAPEKSIWWLTLHTSERGRKIQAGVLFASVTPRRRRIFGGSVAVLKPPPYILREEYTLKDSDIQSFP